ncbi:hypothetical protein HOO65_060272 [Ceratocystis lukuohia]|uniref:Uncharacterized protein n=1 Tax=Ceratocystis lukuohia TaxID=2019550 RepID=A0ABR4MDV2_9PEZI
MQDSPQMYTHPAHFYNCTLAPMTASSEVAFSDVSSNQGGGYEGITDRHTELEFPIYSSEESVTTSQSNATKRIDPMTHIIFSPSGHTPEKPSCCLFQTPPQRPPCLDTPTPIHELSAGSTMSDAIEARDTRSSDIESSPATGPRQQDQGSSQVTFTIMEDDDPFIEHESKNKSPALEATRAMQQEERDRLRLRFGLSPPRWNHPTLQGISGDTAHNKPLLSQPRNSLPGPSRRVCSLSRITPIHRGLPRPVQEPIANAVTPGWGGTFNGSHVMPTRHVSLYNTTSSGYNEFLMDHRANMRYGHLGGPTAPMQPMMADAEFCGLPDLCVRSYGAVEMPQPTFHDRSYFIGGVPGFGQSQCSKRRRGR